MDSHMQIKNYQKLGFNLTYCSENKGIFMFEVKSCPSAIHYILQFLIYNLNNSTITTNIVYLATTKRRSAQLMTIGRKICKFSSIQITNQFDKLIHTKKIIFGTLKDYIELILDKDQTDRQKNKIIIVQTFDIIDEFNKILSDSISDTSIRRAFIEIYKLNAKIKDQTFPTISIEDSEDKKMENSKIDCLQKKQKEKIQLLYTEGKQLLTQSNRNKSSTYFSNFSSAENFLISISVIHYIVGYLQKMEDTLSKSRQIYQKNGEQFLNDFQNKTLLSRKVVKKVQKNMKIIQKAFPQFSMKYIFQICNFFKRIIQCEETFGQTYKKFTVKLQKMEKDVYKSSETTQVIYHLKYLCEDENIVLDLLKGQTNSLCLLQNFCYPKRFYDFIFKDKIKIQEPLFFKNNNDKLFGINISSTPAKQDLTFKDINFDSQSFQQIVKAFGVCLNELALNISDGIIVYFPSKGLIKKCIKEWNSSEKILEKLNENKKIFIEKETEIQNMQEIAKYKRYCDNGSGGLFLTSYKSQTACNETFYEHYSKCIVFISNVNEKTKKVKQYKQKYNIERSINECLNHCVNDLQLRKSIVFLGRDFFDLQLKQWFSFIKKYDCVTFKGVEEVTQSYKRVQ